MLFEETVNEQAEEDNEILDEQEDIELTEEIDLDLNDLILAD